MSKASRRRERKEARRLRYTLSKPTDEEHDILEGSQEKCLFCGAIGGLQRHHIIQKRFNGSDDPANLVMLCPRCHRLYHGLTDLLLDHILTHKKIDNHEIRETVETKKSPRMEVKKDNTNKCIHIDINF